VGVASYEAKGIGGLATGFAVSSDLLVTAGHFCAMVQDVSLKTHSPATISIAYIDKDDKTKELTGATVLTVDPYNDLCVIFSPKHGMIPLQMEKASNVRRLDRVHVLGTPYGIYPTMIDCYLIDKSYAGEDSDLTGRLLSSCTAFHGFSGSPVINENGKVVGTINGTFAPPTDEADKKHDMRVYGIPFSFGATAEQILKILHPFIA